MCESACRSLICWISCLSVSLIALLAAHYVNPSCLNFNMFEEENKSFLWKQFLGKKRSTANVIIEREKGSYITATKSQLGEL